MEKLKTDNNWMKKMLFVVLCLQLSVFLFPLSICEAQVGTWRAYMSYYEPQQIVKGGHILFVRASNSLYTYNLNDQSITTYDKVNALNDTYITHIAWNDAAKRLIIVYKNSNIDLIDREDHVNNISAIYSKSMTQDKTINSIYLHDIYAYLSTGFGIVKINMQRAEVAESYILNENIKAVCINGGSIFAKTASDSVLTAPLSSNLIDFHNWTAGTAPDELFVQDNSDWDNYIDIVQTLKPDGPKYNYFGFLRSYQGRLYSCGGGYSVVQDLNRPAALQMMDSEKTWTTFPEDISEQTGVRYLDLNCVDIDPFDPQRVFASGRTGIYEFKNVQLINHYNNSNTILKGYHDDKNYVTIQGIRFDNHGSLWCLNSMRRDINVVEFTPDNQWVSHFQENLTVDNVPMANMTKPFFDARGLLWFVNDSYLNPSVICYDPAADKLYRMSQFVNQDGVSTKITYIHGITDDKEGNIWIGTNMGLFVILSDDVANAPDVVFNQIKVPRNDGSNYADYLLSGIDISGIAVDGGNRKWVVTNGDGAYLISADNMEQLHHFTTSNSYLLSDIIESVAIDGETGEVFFGTENGLCSYMSNATESDIEAVESDNLVAYPNPVAHYDGLITIKGFAYNSDVKIVTSNGQLVTQGRSNGGTFTWDGRDRNGRRVASGIYMAISATQDGKKSGICKIAIIN